MSAMNMPQAELAGRRRLGRPGWPGPRTAGRGARVRLGSGSLTAGLALLAAMLVFSIVAAFAAPNPEAQDLVNTMVGPGPFAHLLGTDALGRDVLAWVAGGIRTSFEVALFVVALSATFGTAVGIAAGYLGGWLDAVLMRLADIQLAIPPLPLFIAASAILSHNMLTLVVLIAIVGWVPYARLCRAQTLVLRERGYVAAARLAGRRRGVIAVQHLLPGLTTEIAVLGSLQAGSALLWEAGLSFLGLGLQPPYVSLGFLMSEGKEVLQQAWWVATFPGIALALLVVAFNLIGDGIRDLFATDVTGGIQ
jgi:peptide/nickel transport system permease protein